MAEPSTSPRSTVRVVLDQLGPLVLRHDGTGDRGERAVSVVVIDDPQLGPPIARDAVVLGVGAADDPAVEQLLARAEAAGAAAVVVRHRAGRADRSAGRDLVFVEVAPELEWAQLHVFLRSALLHVGPARVGGQQTLFDVANAIALRTDGAVVIEDEQLRVVAYSSLDHEIDDARRATILGRQIPEHYVAQLNAAGVTRHVESSPDPIRFDLDGPGLLPRLVIALRAEGRTIGWLWTITDDERDPAARAALTDAAPDVAAELLRHLTADTRFATDQRIAARQLLDGRPVRNTAALFGGAVTGGWVALLLRPEPGAEAETEALARTAQLAGVYIDAFRVPALVAPVVGPYVEVVVGLTPATTEARARSLLTELADRTRSTFGIDLRAAMGSVVADGRDLPGSRRDALAVLDLLLDRAEPGSASYDEVRSEVALREVVEQVALGDHVTRGAVVDLLASADATDAALAATVRAYLDAGGDVTRTAGALAVHRNTVRYRVQRFGELTGIDLTDPTQRLVTELQLRLTR